MRAIVRNLATTAALLLAACGGSSGPSAGPTPTPTPVPTPTPTASPTATARVYGASPATGLIEFTDGDLAAPGLLFARGYTARDGLYYPGFANAIAAFTAVGSAPGASLQGDYSLKYKQVTAVDHETGLFYQMTAPANVRMVTPVTALLAAPGATASKVKEQLGITNSLFAMVSDPDLATYDAIAEAASGDSARVADAARMHAAILRTLAISAALRSIGPATGFRSPLLSDTTLGDSGSDSGPSLSTRVSSCLTAAPALFIFRNDRMSSIVQCYVNGLALPPAVNLTPTQVQAIAHLIDGYAAAMPVRLESAADKAKWLLGINGYLRPMVGNVVADRTGATAQQVLDISAISPTIINEVSRYAEYRRYNETGRYMPSPDFFLMAANSSITTTDQSLTQNDYVFSNQLFNTGGFEGGFTVLSVSVPAGNAAQIAVVRDAAGLHTITALNGFRGVTYYDYEASAANAEVRTTRVYIRVM